MAEEPVIFSGLTSHNNKHGNDKQDWGISGVRQWHSHGVAIGVPMAYPWRVPMAYLWRIHGVPT